MADKNETITTLHNLLDYDARNFFAAEIQLKKILPEWISLASSVKLKMVLEKYQELVEQHIKMLESFVTEEKINSLTLGNRIMHAFVEEAKHKTDNCADAAIKDACLLACIQGINHFKISTYGTAAAFAKILEMEKHAGAFHEAEINEKKIDDRLSQLAEFEINVNAKNPIVIAQ
jgi:ferritin-like metal-binding protein YciE